MIFFGYIHQGKSRDNIRKMEQKGIKEMIKRIDKDIAKNTQKRITPSRKSK
jgi:hypothetical protein